jgi:hypothetical protein
MIYPIIRKAVSSISRPLLPMLQCAAFCSLFCVLALSVLVLGVLVLGVSGVQAQDEQTANSPGNSQTGEINIDLSAPEKRKDSYAAHQDEAIGIFKQLAATTSKLATGGSSAVTPPSDEVISYLTAVYLYCAVNSGTCPLVLDAILEADIVNSRSAGKASCPTMKRFWNTWVKNGFEDRHKFMVKTSHINVYSQFNSQTRPKFLRSEETIASILSGIASSDTFFRDRYRAGSPQEKLAAKMASLLEQIKQKVPNLFIAMGAQSASSGSETGTPSKKTGSTTRRAR